MTNTRSWGLVAATLMVVNGCSALEPDFNPTAPPPDAGAKDAAVDMGTPPHVTDQQQAGADNCVQPMDEEDLLRDTCWNTVESGGGEQMCSSGHPLSECRNVISLAQTCGSPNCLNQLLDHNSNRFSEDKYQTAKTCVTDCLRENTGMKVSRECLDCFTFSATCSARRCTGPCSQPMTAECAQCQCKNGCIEIANRCTGISDPFCRLPESEPEEPCEPGSCGEGKACNRHGFCAKTCETDADCLGEDPQKCDEMGDLACPRNQDCAGVQLDEDQILEKRCTKRLCTNNGVCAVTGVRQCEDDEDCERGGMQMMCMRDDDCPSEKPFCNDLNHCAKRVCDPSNNVCATQNPCDV